MDAKAQFATLKKRTVEIIREEELIAKLAKKRTLRVKLGIDASGPDIHLGFAVVLRKLREFQELGHVAVLIVGDFTGRIGDPSGRSKTRPQLTDAEVKKNMERYSDQIFRILNRERTEVRYNSEWLARLTATDVVDLSSKCTVARMLERDDFSSRYHENKPIGLHELLYPIFQAYDSVAVEADVELGGTDQKFNLLVGRELQRNVGQEEQVVISMPLLEGLDGVRKMSKSFHNYIGITEPPEEMFGKVMSIPDHLLVKYFELTTNMDEDEIATVRSQLEDGENPRNLKEELALRVVSLYNSLEEAEAAKSNFNRVFREKSVPETMPVHKVCEPRIWVVKLLTDLSFASSNSEARRLISQGAVRVNQEKITDPEYELEIEDEVIMNVGKRKFARIVWESRGNNANSEN
jgi:tyrosyl-tRNA synthetase